MAHLDTLSGYQAGRRYDLPEDLFIGRNLQTYAQIDYLSLPDKEVSRWHARLRHRDGRYYLEDMGSTNGTRVGPLRLEAHEACPLRDGDEIRIGATTLRFRDDAPAGGRLRRPGMSSHAPKVRVDDRHAPELSVILEPAPAGAEASRGPDALADVAAVRRLRAMTLISVSLGRLHDPLAIAHGVLEHIFDIFPLADRACLMTLQGAATNLHPLAWRVRGTATINDDDEFVVSRNVVNAVLEQRRAVLSNDLQSDLRFGAHESVVRLPARSLMCVPLLRDQEAFGLIQVDAVAPAGQFSAEDLHVLTAVATQTAVALHNSQLYRDIGNLLDGFIRASVQAIEARDPSTAGHSFRVAHYARQLAIAVDQSEAAGLRQHHFSPEQLTEIHYAALLHDFGKVGVREHVLRKARRLFPDQEQMLRLRFEMARMSAERQAYRDLLDGMRDAGITADELKMRRERIDRYLAATHRRLGMFLQTILEANNPERPAQPGVFASWANESYLDIDGHPQPLLQPDEEACLTLATGSLTADERAQIRSHVSHTYEFLRLIPWTRELAALPDIAHAHHEKLDGSGYPRGLRDGQITVQARILAIADIYDALTSGDRPYRAGVGAEAALDILQRDANAGRLDAEILKVFIGAELFRQSPPDHG